MREKAWSEGLSCNEEEKGLLSKYDMRFLELRGAEVAVKES